MLAIGRHQDGLICMTDLAHELGFRSQSSVQDPMKALVAAGLLMREDLAEGRVRWYRRVASPAWAWAEELAARSVRDTNHSLSGLH